MIMIIDTILNVNSKTGFIVGKKENRVFDPSFLSHCPFDCIACLQDAFQGPHGANDCAFLSLSFLAVEWK